MSQYSIRLTDTPRVHTGFEDFVAEQATEGTPTVAQHH
jgi:hypothetical protein